MSAAELAATTEQLALVAPLGERPTDPGARGSRVPAILLEHQGQLLPDELRARDAALAGCPRQQPIGFRIQRYRGGLLSRECHQSNITLTEPRVKCPLAARIMRAR